MPSTQLDVRLMGSLVTLLDAVVRLVALLDPIVRLVALLAV